MPLVAGASTKVINCRVGDDLAGQIHRRLCERIRDNLEANLLYLRSDKAALMLVNLDLAGLFTREYVVALQGEIERAAHFPASNVLITSTHTHTAPDTLGLLYDSPPNERYLAELRAALAEAASEAASVARPAQLGCATGRAQVGFNRRVCWADGSHSMYGDASRAEFTGLEGPDDPTHTVLLVLDAENRPLALVHNNCCHATCVESETFASADFPGEARRLIREGLGTALPVLYLQGASGDISPWNLLSMPQRYDSEMRLREVGLSLAAETLRLTHEMCFTNEPVLEYAAEELALGVRLPTSEQVAHAEAVVAKGEQTAGRWNYVLSLSGILRLHREFKDRPTDCVPIHAVRIGELAIVTNPCELYCQFGLDIRRRSPAKHMMVAELCNGFVGYCPTIYGLLGGGYSGDPIYWCRLEPAAGYRIVDCSERLVHQIYR